MGKRIGGRVLLTVDGDLLKRAGEVAQRLCIARARVLVGWMRLGEPQWAAQVRGLGVVEKETAPGQFGDGPEAVGIELQPAEGSKLHGQYSTGSALGTAGVGIATGRRGVARTGGPGQSM